MNEWFCTVFPNDLDEMPQDFESYVEANSRDEALKRVEEEYWKNPNNYVLEPRDTYFE